MSEHPTNAPQGAKIDDGGQAFPGHRDHGGGRIQSWTGMSLRAYFMAHAPETPQPWFCPVLADPDFDYPAPLTEITEDERRELDGWREGAYGAHDLRNPRVRAFASATEECRKVANIFSLERQRQLYLQWPAAWADAQLAILKGRP